MSSSPLVLLVLFVLVFTCVIDHVKLMRMLLATLDEIRPPPRILTARERANTDISVAEEPTNAVSLCVFVRCAGTADVGA